MGFNEIRELYKRNTIQLNQFIHEPEQNNWEWFKQCEKLNSVAWDLCQNSDKINERQADAKLAVLLNFEIRHAEPVRIDETEASSELQPKTFEVWTEHSGMRIRWLKYL